MKKTAAFLIFLLAASAFGQSAFFNQRSGGRFPRITIPHIDPPQTLVNTNGTVIANPYRNLKYCDFVLKCIDQSGERTTTNSFGNPTPILYYYNSMAESEESFAVNDAVVFYQNNTLPRPLGTMRIAGGVKSWEALTKNNMAFPEHIFCRVQDYPTSDQENILQDVEAQYWTKEDVYPGMLTEIDILFERTVNGPLYILYTPVNAPSSSALYLSVKKDLTTGEVFFYNRRNYNRDLFSSFYDFDGYVINREFKTLDPAPSAFGPLMIASENTATAIEVYPNPDGRASWMYPGNDKIKWMCLLSNGIDFYTDPATGKPVWFNVNVEWVRKIPDAGVWNEIE